MSHPRIESCGGGFLRFRRLFFNTLLLTAASFLMQTVGIAFQTYLTRRIGAAGVGLFHLTMSVNAFAATVAITGVRFATMRIVSQEVGLHRGEGAKQAVRISLCYGAFFGSLAAILLGMLAPQIGEKMIGDLRTIPSLYRLAISLPFLSMGTVFAGYFTAVGKVWLATLKGFAEQIIRIAVSCLLLERVAGGNVEAASLAVVTGGVAGEVGGFLVGVVLYQWESRNLQGEGNQNRSLFRRIVEVAVPLGIAAYARTALNAVKNLLTPRAFRRYGLGQEEAMADYGVVQGMVFPVLLFPSALVGSLAELLVPEVTRLEASDSAESIAGTANKVLELTAQFSFITAAVIGFHGPALSQALYHSNEAGPYLSIFSLLIPVMYLDMITDSLLKGLGEQVYSMRINVYDSLLSTLMILILVPRFGMAGYGVVLFLSETFNFTASIYKLSQRTCLRFDLRKLCASLMISLLAVAFCQKMTRGFGEGTVSVIISIISSLILYIAISLQWNPKQFVLSNNG